MVDQSVVDYVDHLPLEEDVELSLVARSILDLPRYQQHHSYDFSLRLCTPTESHTVPLARVLRAPEAQQYGTKRGRVTEIQQILREAVIAAPGRMLEPFTDPHELGLEPRMSSDSVLYVFSGLMEYAQEITEREGRVSVAQKHEVNQRLLSCLAPIVQGVFEGYRVHTLRDYDLWRREEMVRKVG